MKMFKETFAVWRERDDRGEKGPMISFTDMPLEAAQEIAKQFNDEEVGNAKAEMRQIRTRFFVAHVVHSYEEVQS